MTSGGLRWSARDLTRAVARLVLLILTAHAVAYFLHEFAHSFVAWFLDAKSHPLALDYGGLTPANVLMQVDIDENVDYDPLFASGRSAAIATIAAAGIVLGNAVPFFLLTGWLGRMRSGANTAVGLFVLFLALMCAGNVLSYIPMRVITTHGDMATVARALNMPSGLLLIVGIPLTLLTLVVFFRWTLAYGRRFLERLPALDAALLLSAIPAIYFGFFGSGSVITGRYGDACQLMGMASLLVGLPLSAALIGSSPRDGASTAQY